MQAQKLLGPHQMAFSGLQSHYGGNPFSPTTSTMGAPPFDSMDPSSRPSHLANISEDDPEPANARPANYERTTQSVLGASMGMSMIGGMSRREGPPHVSQDGLLYSICGGTTHVDNTVATEFTATDMCLSTLYLHELHHRQIRRRNGANPSQLSKSVWQQPHQTAPMGGVMSATTDGIGFSQPGTSSSVAVERTPLLAPKKS